MDGGFIDTRHFATRDSCRVINERVASYIYIETTRRYRRKRCAISLLVFATRDIELLSKALLAGGFNITLTLIAARAYGGYAAYHLGFCVMVR